MAATVFSSGVIAVTTTNSERFKNELLRQFIDEKISQIATNLQDETLDWSIWNATYDHVLGRNPSYYADEYTQYSFARTPFVAAFNARGELVSSSTWDSEQRRVKPLTAAETQAMRGEIPKGHPLEATTFLATFRNRPFLFSLQPIRRTHSSPDTTSDTVGRLLFARPLDTDDVTFKASTTLNRALGVTHESYGKHGDGGSIDLWPLNPLRISVPLQRWQGVRPMGLQIQRTPRERWTGLMVISGLLSGSALLCLITMVRTAVQQRRLRLLRLEADRRQLQINRDQERQRDHDALTGLLSESGLIKAVQRQAQRFPDFRQAMVFLDLDHFSLVNNGLGREQGDRVLQAFGRRLAASIHSSGAAARVGADEFACCLMGTSEIALRSEISALSQQLNDSPIRIDDQTVNVSASVGAALVEEQQAATALHEASIACSVVKVAGGHGHQLFGDAQATTSSYLTIQQRNQELVNAIREQRIDLYAQNAWLLSEGERLPSVYVELLCRIKAADSGKHYWHENLIQAAQFCGSLPLLDRSVLEQACRDLQTLMQRQPARQNSLVYAINVTADSLFLPSFRQSLERLVEVHDLDPSRICLEITEQAALRNPGEAITALKKLRRHGFRIALDDFGTGMTSLGYLRDLPLDYVKIDKSFIRKLEHDAASRLIVQFVVELSKEIGFQTIAEGVEDRKLLQQVQQLGITIAQGYLITHPRPLLAPIEEWHLDQAGCERFAGPQADLAAT